MTVTSTRARIAIVFAILISAATASAQVPDEQSRADIEKLLDVTGASALGTQMATLLSNQLLDSMSKSNPNVPARAVAIIKEVLSTEFERAFTAPDGLRADIVRIYAKHFTHDEIVGLLTFYESPIGRKAVSVLPSITQESAAAGQAWAIANIPRMTAAVEQRLRAENLIP